MSATAQTERQLGRLSHIVLPSYSLTLSARSGPYPLGGYYYPSHICRHIAVNPPGLPFAYPTTYRSGHNRLFRLWIIGLDA